MPLKNTLAAYLPSSRSAKRQSSILGVAALALAGSAILVNRRAAKAEREDPPKGAFVTTDGVRLTISCGEPPVVFLHGNGAMVDDTLISGVIDHAARQYRATLDRPGLASERAQAALIAVAFARLGIERPIVVSTGARWSLILPLHPGSVAGLVLASGYYFPTARADVALLSPPSIPLLGDAISYTVAPFIGEIMGPSMIKKMFAPQPVSPRFEREFPIALALRPSQIKAFSEDTSHMIAAAAQLPTGALGALVVMAVTPTGSLTSDGRPSAFTARSPAAALMCCPAPGT
jgi:pimeloyl-ACP methyl ester carboxylesterase